MKNTNGFIVLMSVVAVSLLGFIAGKVAEPPQVAPTYTPWPTYTPVPTYTRYPSPTPINLPVYSHTLEYPQSAIVNNYPRVDGSTSTKPLEDLIVCRFYSLHCVWELNPYYSESGFAERYIRFFVQTGGHDDVLVAPRFRFPPTDHHGTHVAYMNLIDGTSDFILVARMPSEDELDSANAKGITLDARPVALDAFVMLAHADNPVATVSLDQVRGIYSGKITNWSQVDGNDAPIHAYQREDNSGSQELLKALVMGDLPIINAPEMIVETMAGPFNVIEGFPNLGVPGDINAIAYSVYYYTWFIMESLRDVKILAVNKIRPTSQTIADRSYPLISEVYVVIRAGESPDSTAVLLRDWLLTRNGQFVVQGSGYIPITPIQ